MREGTAEPAERHGALAVVDVLAVQVQLAPLGNYPTSMLTAQVRLKWRQSEDGPDTTLIQQSSVRSQSSRLYQAAQQVQGHHNGPRNEAPPAVAGGHRYSLSRADVLVFGYSCRRKTVHETLRREGRLRSRIRGRSSLKNMDCQGVYEYVIHTHMESRQVQCFAGRYAFAFGRPTVYGAKALPCHPGALLAVHEELGHGFRQWDHITSTFDSGNCDRVCSHSPTAEENLK